MIPELPKILYKNAVAKAEDRTFTRLLDNNKLAIKSSFLLMRFSTNFAFLFPCLDFVIILAFETAVIAVSDPDKKPETITKISHTCYVSATKIWNNIVILQQILIFCLLRKMR